MSLSTKCSKLVTSLRRACTYVHVGTSAVHGNVLLCGQAMNETDHLRSQPLPNFHCNGEWSLEIQ